MTDKAAILARLDLRDITTWHSNATPDLPSDAVLEWAFVNDSNDETFIVLRSATDPAAMHVFTTGEWDAFLKGARAGEFDLPPAYR